MKKQADAAAKIARNTYTKGELFGFLVGMFGQNLIYQVIAAGLVSVYLGTVLYIPAGIVSAITWSPNHTGTAMNEVSGGSIDARTR